MEIHLGAQAELAQRIVSTNPITIISNYKGIILTQPVQVLSMGPERVILQAPDLTVCFTIKDRIQLYSREFQEIISARLLEVNPTTGRLELADLAITGWHWYDRQADRVQPRDPIYVDGKDKNALIRACLDNLSAQGMSLMIYKYKERPVPFGRDSIVSLTFQLPGEEIRLHLKAKVLHERQTGRLGILGMQLMSSSTQEKHINRYVLARKAEILGELEQTSREFYTQPSRPCLYS
jgi:hypothetical protein